MNEMQKQMYLYELAQNLAQPGIHLYVIPGEDVYMYNTDDDSLKMNTPEYTVKEGMFRDRPINRWWLFYRIKEEIDKGAVPLLLPITGCDPDVISKVEEHLKNNDINDIIKKPNLSQKEILDMLGLNNMTDHARKTAAGEKAKEQQIDDILNELRNEFL